MRFFSLARLFADSDSSYDFKGDQGLRAISEVGEFRNWAATVQTAPAKVLRPKSAKDVLKVLKKAGEGIGGGVGLCVHVSWCNHSSC